MERAVEEDAGEELREDVCDAATAFLNCNEQGRLAVSPHSHRDKERLGTMLTLEIFVFDDMTLAKDRTMW